MSLCKAIYYGKEHRKEYRGAKRFDSTCRNHGSCSYCRDQRTYHKNRTEEHSRLDLTIWHSGQEDRV